MESYSRYNVAIVLIAAFGSIFTGYALAVIVATTGQPTFYSSLNLESDSTAPGYSHTTTIIGAANGVFFGAAVLGTFLSGVTCDKLGRVGGFRIGASIGVIGGILQTSAVNQAMYLVARFTTGLAAGHIGAAMPTYYAEVAPPHSRGMMGGAHGSFINFGYFSSGWIGFACFNAHGTTFAWRFPNAVIVLLGLCVLIGSFFVPESPRWLVGRGEDHRALEILCKLHHDKNDPEDHFAHRELLMIKSQLDADHAAFETGGPWQIFTQKTYRKRLILGTMMAMGSQNVGILVINNYNTLLYQSLGLTTSQSLILGAGYNTWAMIANFAGAFNSDRIGRRRVVLFGYTWTVSMFIIATSLIAKYSETPSKMYAATAVVFLFLYVTGHGFAIDVNTFTIIGEIFPSHLRSQGSSISLAALFTVDTLWLDLASTAMTAIGWKYYTIFIGLGVVHIIFIYFKLPDTTGLALEEIDALFGKECPPDRDADLGDTVGSKLQVSHLQDV